MTVLPSDMCSPERYPRFPNKMAASVLRYPQPPLQVFCWVSKTTSENDIVDAIAKNPTGKILRRKLMEND